MITCDQLENSPISYIRHLSVFKNGQYFQKKIRFQKRDQVGMSAGSL